MTMVASTDAIGSRQNSFVAQNYAVARQLSSAHHPAMAITSAAFARVLSLVCLFSTIPSPSSALKFEIQAYPSGHHTKGERCIQNFVAKDTLVVVTATVSGSRGDGQSVNMHVSAMWPWREVIVLMSGKIKDAVGNDYGRPRDVAGEQRMAFTSHADSAFDVCFENVLTSRKQNPVNPQSCISRLTDAKTKRS